MILRRYGKHVHSVDVEFSAHAFNEVGFRRNRDFQMPVEELETYTAVETHELAAEHDGDVHSEVEQALLDQLEAGLRSVEAGLDEGELLCVENEQKIDWPKTRFETKNVVVQGENRLYFHGSIRPPLRVAVYRKS